MAAYYGDHELVASIAMRHVMQYVQNKCFFFRVTDTD